MSTLPGIVLDTASLPTKLVSTLTSTNQSPVSQPEQPPSNLEPELEPPTPRSLAENAFRKEREVPSTNDTEESRPLSGDRSVVSNAPPDEAQQADLDQPHNPGIFGAGQTIASGVIKGLNSGVTATANLSQSGATLIKDVADGGLDISQKVAKSGVDTTTNVISDTANLAGTAVGGIIDQAASAGQVFEPVASSLKAVEGFGKLGDNADRINGLVVGAVKQIGDWSVKALNVSGMVPTFFDQDADGIVRLEDTIHGLTTLGMDTRTAKYAAYALHVVFSYPTGSTWVPSDASLPIHIKNMGRTRWGRHWGCYDRLDWFEDVDIDAFFSKGGESTGWQQKYKKGRQNFGILLLVFEWGTTWPLLLPVHELPFKDEIGPVIQKLVLPTIITNYRRNQTVRLEKNNE